MEQIEYIRLEQKILESLPVRKQRSNKGTYGKVLCIAGSKNMAGAAYLCAYAAYRTGAGLVRVLTPEENRVIIQTLLPEAVLTTFDSKDPDMDVLREALVWADVTAIGPGLGKEAWAEVFVELVLKEYKKPLVIDADGINHLCKNQDLLKECKGPVIVTPHVGEFSRLSGKAIPDILEHIPEYALAYAEEYHCICVLKDAPSAVGFFDGRCWVNTTGNNGMSTGGSGDVLTGMIAGLLAQKTEPLHAALLGVWLHGKSGDLAAEKEGTYGLLARHLIEYLPGAMSFHGK
ncbi:MAG: NAD(P)H-hydrate dehydratase [Lachnospiraceae bacterium]|nr:NAD(P)H-hydrate dehydratase [Lachnospiraceae bacterium]